MESTTLATKLAVFVVLTIVTVDTIRRILRNRSERKGHPLPPGPTQLPFLGSILSVNTQSIWLTFTEWKAKYGDILYTRVLATEIIVLNSTTVAADLLEKRSQIYSDRPRLTLLAAPYFDFHFGSVRYGERWKLCRRIFHQTFRADAALRFRPMQLRRARQLIVDMINNPDEYPSHFSTFSTAIAMSATYDHEPSPRNDPIVSIVDNFLRVAVPGLAPAKIFLVEAFPFLLNIPHWLPGSWMRREVREGYAWRNKMVETPYQYALERMGSGDCTNVSMMSDHIIEMAKSDGSYRTEYETALKHACATTLPASADTTASTLMTFTLAMVQHPHAWKRAQGEIDGVVGAGRLPEFDNRPFLPYVDAIVREVLRWRPVLPLGVPHAVTQSDIYKGYYIPKGAMVISNIWAMSRDEARYPDANKFMPERFLNTDGMLIDDNIADFIFGFGRRICPGRYAADASLWGAIVTMLATLDFNHAKDADGNDITFKATFVNGATECPRPFPCRLTPRPHVNKEMLDLALAQ